MVFCTTFNNISVIFWQSVLLVGKQEYTDEITGLQQVTYHLQTLSHNVV